MPNRLTAEQFSTGMDQLVEEGLLLPHGFPVGSFPGGVRPFNTAAEWRNYQFNPPGFLSNDPRFSTFSARDPEAGPKPSWAQIVSAYQVAVPVQARERLNVELRAECHRLITAAYGEVTIGDEILLRLRGGHTEGQDTERDRLRAVYATLKTRIETMTLPQLDAFDPTNYAHWRRPVENSDGMG